MISNYTNDMPQRNIKTASMPIGHLAEFITAKRRQYRAKIDHLTHIKVGK